MLLSQVFWILWRAGAVAVRTCWKVSLVSATTRLAARLARSFKPAWDIEERERNVTSSVISVFFMLVIVGGGVGVVK